jgi:glutamyl-Q tRNA(Asp) synthetase
LAASVGDFALLRENDGQTEWTYQLAVVVDDAAQGVTHVVRGADLLDSTARQIALQRALGYPTPIYSHFPLLVNEDGEKLSKSGQAPALDAMDDLAVLLHAWRFLGGKNLSVANVSEFWAAVLVL